MIVYPAVVFHLGAQHRFRRHERFAVAPREFLRMRLGHVAVQQLPFLRDVLAVRARMRRGSAFPRRCVAPAILRDRGLVRVFHPSSRCLSRIVVRPTVLLVPSARRRCNGRRVRWMLAVVRADRCIAHRYVTYQVVLCPERAFATVAGVAIRHKFVHCRS